MNREMCLEINSKKKLNRKRLEKLGLSILLQRRMTGDLIETFRIINGISIYGRHIFNISPQTENLLSRKITKTKSINNL